MVTTVDRLITRLEVDASKSIKSIEMFNRTLDMSKKRMDMFDRASAAGLSKTDKLTKQNAVSMAQFEHEQKKATASQQKFMGTLTGIQNMLLGLGMSMLFTGMAVSMYMQNILTGLITNFVEIEGESSELGNKINQLKAAFISAMYNIVDAADQAGVFDKWIERLDWIANWVEENPQKFVKFVDAAVWILGASFAAMILGQVLLFLLGPLAILIFMVQKGMFPIFLKIAGVLLIIAGAFMLWKMVMESDMPPIVKLILSVLIAMSSVLLIAMLLGLTITSPFLLGAAAIGIFLAGMWLLSDAVGGIKNAFKALGIFLLAVLAFIGDGIYNLLISPLRVFIDILNGLISTYNLIVGVVGGDKIDTIKQPKVAPLSEKVWEQRNKLLEEGVLKKQEKERLEREKAEADKARAASEDYDPTMSSVGGKSYSVNIENMNVSSDDPMSGFKVLEYVEEAVGFSEGSTNNNTGA